MSIVNPHDELKIEVTPRLSRLPGLFESVENFGSDNNVPEANVYVINLILDELITNYISHSVGRVQAPKIKRHRQVRRRRPPPHLRGQRSALRSDVGRVRF